MAAVADPLQAAAFEKGGAPSHAIARAALGGAAQIPDRQAALDLHAFYAPWGEVALQRCLEPFERRMHELETTLVDKDSELSRLRKRVAELEGRLAALDSHGAASGSSRALLLGEQVENNVSLGSAPSASEVPTVSRGSVLRIVREEVGGRRHESDSSRPGSTRDPSADAEQRVAAGASAVSRKEQQVGLRGPSPQRTLSRERRPTPGTSSARHGTFFGTYTTSSKELAEERRQVSLGVHAASTGQLPNAHHLGGVIGTASTGSLPISPALSTGSSSVASNAVRGRRALSAPKAGRAFR